MPDPLKAMHALSQASGDLNKSNAGAADDASDDSGEQFASPVFNYASSDDGELSDTAGETGDAVPRQVTTQSVSDHETAEERMEAASAPPLPEKAGGSVASSFTTLSNTKTAKNSVANTNGLRPSESAGVAESAAPASAITFEENGTSKNQKQEGSLEDGGKPRARYSRRCIIICSVFCLIIVAAAVVVPVVITQQNKGGGKGAPKVNTLEDIMERGVVRCGVSGSHIGRSALNSLTRKREGFNADLCRALGAAVFGDPTQIEFVIVTASSRFSALKANQVDVLLSSDTHTMERDLVEPITGSAFSFSIPYVYSGMVFAGVPPYAGCANIANITDECRDMTVCVVENTTFVPLTRSLLPAAVDIVFGETEDECYLSLRDGKANVIAADQFEVSELLVRATGFTGDYEVGEITYSKEPLAMVTRDDDPVWSDFVNWVLEALIGAEELNIEQGTAQAFDKTDLFGELYQDMFINALAAVGNYGELYNRHLEPLIPRTRSPLNGLNVGSTGLMYSTPFGSVATEGPGPIPGGTLGAIFERGYLRCGVSRRAIFAVFDSKSETWTGFDVDFCRALSAAIFDGVTSTVVFVDLPATERFVALQNGDVDVLSRITTVTYIRDVKEPTTEVGFSFAKPNFYDGLSFGGIPPYGQCANDLNYQSWDEECQGLKICVNNGTTYFRITSELFPNSVVVPQQSGELVAQGLTSGECNAIAGGIIDVSRTNVKEVGGYAGEYETGTNRFSKDPLALVTRHDDVQWSSFVYWLVMATFYAEEQRISTANSTLMPIANGFGKRYARFMRNAIGAVGSYKDIYDRNVEAEVPRGSLNLLNTAPFGPQHYAKPGLPFSV